MWPACKGLVFGCFGHMPLQTSGLWLLFSMSDVVEKQELIRPSRSGRLKIGGYRNMYSDIVCIQHIYIY